MAIKMKTKFKGLDIDNGYFKINGLTIRDIIEDEIKKWSVDCLVSFYLDSTKEYLLKGNFLNYNFIFDDISKLTYENAYKELHKLDIFETGIKV